MPWGSSDSIAWLPHNYPLFGQVLQANIIDRLHQESCCLERVEMAQFAICGMLRWLRLPLRGVEHADELIGDALQLV
jgi:hypothetical protein